jgi:hypothetical protein
MKHEHYAFIPKSIVNNGSEFSGNTKHPFIFSSPQNDIM